MEEIKNNELNNENQNEENQVPQQPKKESKIVRFAKNNVKTVVAFALGFTAKVLLDTMFGRTESAPTGAETPVTTQVPQDGTEITNF